MDVYAKSNLYKFLERKKDREKLTQRFPSFFKLVYCMYFVYFLLFRTTYALAITNISKEYNSKYNTKMKFPKFKKKTLFLSQTVRISVERYKQEKKKHHIIYTHISKHDISSKRLPYVYASRITRPFSISLAMAENKG